jgi:tRNA (adenine37-N6)-methyltransferase
MSEQVEEYLIRPVGHVRGGRTEPIDDQWGSVTATIELDRSQFTTDVVAGLDAFSHVEVVFLFDRVDATSVQLGARHPRVRPDWPLVGMFAQRARMRPNRLGVTVCELLSVEGLDVRVRGLDAIDGSPVIDLKPYMAEFGPRGPTRQPAWASELMTSYWDPA